MHRLRIVLLSALLTGVLATGAILWAENSTSEKTETRRVEPIFTKEPLGATVVVTAVPGFVLAGEFQGEGFAIPIGGKREVFYGVPPEVLKALKDVAWTRRPMEFTVRTYRSTGYADQRIHAEPEIKSATPDQKTVYEIPVIGRIRFDGRLIYALDVCEVHGTPLRVEALPIGYGYMIRTKPIPKDAVSVAKFPYAETLLSGGCCITSDSPTHRERYVCDRCREALAAWEKNPPPDEQWKPAR